MEKYNIKVPHFYCMEYYENNKKMIIQMDFREARFLLNKDLITNWEEPYENELISESDKERILLNVREFLLTKTVPSNIIMQEE